MSVIIGLGAWIALNAALAAALLLRRDRPESRKRLFDWVLKGGRLQQSTGIGKKSAANRHR